MTLIRDKDSVYLNISTPEKKEVKNFPLNLTFRSFLSEINRDSEINHQNMMIILKRGFEEKVLNYYDFREEMIKDIFIDMDLIILQEK